MEEAVDEPRLVYQDELIAVVDKPAGLVVHPAPGHRGKTLADIVREWGGPWSEVAGRERPGIVHRLDRGTSGLMVLARTDTAHVELSQQLRARTMGREYWALVRGHFREARGRIDAAVGRDPAQPRRMAVTGGGREAATEFFVLERFADQTSIRLRLLSGRTHQIRVHLAYIGRPLVGDGLYGHGGDRSRPALHAAMLHLRHPGSGREMVFCSRLPADLEKLRLSLGGSPEATTAYPWSVSPGAMVTQPKEPPATRGRLFVLSGPSGVGKDTVIRRLLELRPQLARPVAYTTRRPRPGELDGREYSFVSEEEFEERAARDEFLETAVVHQSRYGTSRIRVEELRAAGRDVLLKIDVQGAASLREQAADAVFIFLAPPSREVLLNRLTSRRTENPEEVALRTRDADRELAEAHWYNHQVVNDLVERVVGEIGEIVASAP